jgi:hypothetical protein
LRVSAQRGQICVASGHYGGGVWIGCRRAVRVTRSIWIRRGCCTRMVIKRASRRATHAAGSSRACIRCSRLSPRRVWSRNCGCVRATAVVRTTSCRFSSICGSRRHGRSGGGRSAPTVGFACRNCSAYGSNCGCPLSSWRS